MTVNGKRDGFERGDLLTVADTYGIRGAADIIDRVIATVSSWNEIAKDHDVDPA